VAVRNSYSYSAASDHPYGHDTPPQVNYVLHTGRFWKGPIRKARIQIEFNDRAYQPTDHFGEPRCDADWHSIVDLNHNPRFAWFDDSGVGLRGPDGGLKVSQHDGRTVLTWTIRDFEPQDDIEIPYCTMKGPRAALVSRIRAVDIGAIAEKGYAERLRNFLLATYGSTFKDPTWQRLFNGRHWYVRKPQFDVAQITGADRELLGTLEARIEVLEKTKAK